MTPYDDDDDDDYDNEFDDDVTQSSKHQELHTSERTIVPRTVIFHSSWVKYDPYWPRMTDYGPGWHTRGQGFPGKLSPSKSWVLSSQPQQIESLIFGGTICRFPRKLDLGKWGPEKLGPCNKYIFVYICQGPIFQGPNLNLNWIFMKLFWNEYWIESILGKIQILNWINLDIGQG